METSIKDLHETFNNKTEAEIKELVKCGKYKKALTTVIALTSNEWNKLSENVQWAAELLNQILYPEDYVEENPVIEVFEGIVNIDSSIERGEVIYESN